MSIASDLGPLFGLNAVWAIGGPGGYAPQRGPPTTAQGADAPPLASWCTRATGQTRHARAELGPGGRASAGGEHGSRVRKISIVLSMPAKISGGGRKFQSFRGGWDKWEALPLGAIAPQNAGLLAPRIRARDRKEDPSFGAPLVIVEHGVVGCATGYQEFEAQLCRGAAPK